MLVSVNVVQSLGRPWLSMFTSRAVWASFLFNFFDGLAYYALFSGVPVYMKQILRFDISEVTQVDFISNLLK